MVFSFQPAVDHGNSTFSFLGHSCFPAFSQSFSVGLLSFVSPLLVCSLDFSWNRQCSPVEIIRCPRAWHSLLVYLFRPKLSKPLSFSCVRNRQSSRWPISPSPCTSCGHRKQSFFQNGVFHMQVQLIVVFYIHQFFWSVLRHFSETFFLSLASNFTYRLFLFIARHCAAYTCSGRITVQFKLGHSSFVVDTSS